MVLKMRKIFFCCQKMAYLQILRTLPKSGKFRFFCGTKSSDQNVIPFFQDSSQYRYQKRSETALVLLVLVPCGLNLNWSLFEWPFMSRCTGEVPSSPTSVQERPLHLCSHDWLFMAIARCWFTYSHAKGYFRFAKQNATSVPQYVHRWWALWGNRSPGDTLPNRRQKTWFRPSQGAFHARHMWICQFCSYCPTHLFYFHNSGWKMSTGFSCCSEITQWLFETNGQEKSCVHMQLNGSHFLRSETPFLQSCDHTHVIAKNC